MLGRDLSMRAGDLMAAASGDAAVAVGTACLLEDMVNRFDTPRGTLLRHPEYGFDVWRFLHLEDLPVHRMDLEQTARETAEQDPRVVPGSVSAEVLSWASDVLRFRLTFRAIASTNPLNLVLVADGASQTVSAEA